MTFSEKAAGELKLRLREELERARATARRTPAESACWRGGLRLRRSARQHHSRLLRRAAARAAGRSARRSGLHGADRHASRPHLRRGVPSWLHEQLAKPGRGRPPIVAAARQVAAEDDESDGPIERLRRAARSCASGAITRRHGAAVYDRQATSRRSMAAAEGVCRDDRASRSSATTTSQRHRRRGAPAARSSGSGARSATWCRRASATAGKRRSSRWPTIATLRSRRKGTGAAFAIGVTREQALAAHAQLLQDLRAFRERADADLAALLHEEMRECLRRYEARKQEAGALDFLDLLIKARDLVRDDAEVRREFRERFRVLLVDEFQDTDPLQAELLLLLAGEGDGRRSGPARSLSSAIPSSRSIASAAPTSAPIARSATSSTRRARRAVTLQTSFRSVPAIQRFVNAAFRDRDDRRSTTSLQADYVPLLPPAATSARAARGGGVAGAAAVRQASTSAASDADGAQEVAAAARSRSSSRWLLSPECSGRLRTPGRPATRSSPETSACCSAASCISATT